ncbi:EKC/KEOPS complex subunit TP53RK-like isoform X2 [Vespa mandarinia]|nr:EKC/KEOPS complex subunit TP53RK-like isoform X2 [Vespa mandarinia]XP_035721001.1 EKC/KEOPS complex subunit TP53RK-like isoform X2 [Vespa mandarinia]XP_035721002.1 EKC/KEOPS complex subunit TP53RK-like isoform X2 [Vespa mandarinia]XP_035721003.1 EKC/KEOPS complex subunit TP53RK-like isoform X2 [Vespa mandarinia]XP_035721004.1 EKC/KEOPS complex subunit TP53RK-like isoform X2 [Vespa mandarinia]XP_035721005.1 EKC/KEOPS complex subunit TP53RK-like isoform X2 [Vespa mandarinia]XP_035721006.1 EK
MDGFELISQGAEACLYKGTYLGKSTIVKERFVKGYRHPDLDKRLTKDRLKAEARAILRAKSAGIPTPALYLINLDRRTIYMEHMENTIVLKNYIDENVSDKVNVEHIIKFIGEGLGLIIAKLHSKNIIHGDLTTSNVLLKNISDETWTEDEALNHFVMIDFGLAQIDSTVEDKAVDIYVLERSLLSAHSEVSTLFPLIYESYQKHYANKAQCKEIVNKYEEVRARGRKHSMIG